MTSKEAGAARRRRLVEDLSRMQLELEAREPPSSLEAFKAKREEAIFDALLFAVSGIAKPQGGWRFAVDEETVQEIVHRLGDVMSVVRTLPVVEAHDHAAAVDQARRHIAAIDDPAFQALLRRVGCS